MSDKRYLIDYEIIGTLVVDANNPQAASARAQSVLRAIAKGLNEGAAYDAEFRIQPPVGLAAKCLSS